MTEVVRNYLLGRHEDETFEAELLADPARHEEVDATVRELLDDYAADRLSGDDRRAVEVRLLATPQGRFQLRAARAFARRAAQLPRPARWKRWLAFAVPALVAATAAIVLWLRPAPGGDDEVSTLALVATTRDATVPEVTLGGARVLQLTLPVTPAAGASVEVVGPGAKRFAPALVGASFELPAEKLPAGGYEVTVTTGGESQFYAFRVR
jgi:hypothetical protein